MTRQSNALVAAAGMNYLEILMMSAIRCVWIHPKPRLSGVTIAAVALITTSCATTGATDFERATVEFLAPDVSVSEERLVSVEQAHPGTFRFCLGSEGHRYAFARKRGELWSVVLDGNEGEDFEKLAATATLLDRQYPRLYPGFSKDCSRFAYAGRRDALWHVVVNEDMKPDAYESEPISVLESLDEITRPFSSPKAPSKDVRIVEEDRERYVVVDGRELKHYSIGAKGGALEGALNFFCYGTMAGDCSFTGYGPIGLVYSDDAQERIGYLVHQKRGLLYVIDEVEYGPYDSYVGELMAGPIIFSSDGRHFAFQAMRDGRGILNVDGVDILSMPVLRYRESGTFARSDMTFPYEFLESDQLQTYAIKNNELFRLIIDVAE